MPEENSSAPRRAAEWLLQRALRFWPRESGKWGRALAAELPSVENSYGALRWAVGGLMLLIREWFRHALGSWKRPIGVPAGGPLESEWKNAPRVPRTPRIVTALLLVASTCLLVTPDVRHAMNKGLLAWRKYALWSEDEGAVAKLRTEAKSHRDPQLLAVLAIMSYDDGERIRDAAEAVKADPSLTWIYSKIFLNVDPCCMLHPPIESGVAALENWDPDNAVPRFLAADQIYERVKKDWISRSERPSYYFDPGLVARDPEWRAAMDFAFAAPKYDPYNAKALDLYRSVSTRYGINEPEFAVSFFERSALLWGLRNVGSAVYFERGEEAERSGRLDDAVFLYWKPVLFAEQVLSQDHSDEWVSQEVISTERSAFQKLEPLLSKMGRSDEARVVHYRLASAQVAVENQNRRWWWRFNRDGWAGLTIRSLAPIILLLGVAIVLSICVLFLRCRKGSEPSRLGSASACAAIDLCPVLLLSASAGLFVAYHPIALAYQRAISSPWNASTIDDIFYSANAPYGIPLPLGEFSATYLNAYHFWIAAIVALSMLALYILFRRALNRSTI
jgi:hypothetical protein